MELMIVLVIVGILAAIATPGYQRYVVKSSRAAAQAELLQLASLQEKIYLNSNSYTGSLTDAYNGTSSGGLGSTGKTADGRYVLSVAPATPAQNFTLRATPVVGSAQDGDGVLSVDSTGRRLQGGTVAW
jgi:type IV pilus assembly protein PilE